LTIATGDSGFAIPAGQRVMWRISSHAVLISPGGAYSGKVDAVELRRGERYVRLNIAGVRFDIANEDARLREGSPCRIDVDARGLSVWYVS
jgi:molybdate transport system permease protein